MLGYWDDAEATAAAIDAGRWMHTGDLATMDAEGYVNIVGRSKDMIIRGGENIYPREIEEFLYGHPKIRDVQVIGVPDEQLRRGGDGLGHPQAGSSDDEPRSLRDYCRGQIAHYKVPRYWRFVDEFPMTVTGKIQKYKMRERPSRSWGSPGPARVTPAISYALASLCAARPSPRAASGPHVASALARSERRLRTRASARSAPSSPAPTAAR